jgi:hypothetical protein
LIVQQFRSIGLASGSEVLHYKDTNEDELKLRSACSAPANPKHFANHYLVSGTNSVFGNTDRLNTYFGANLICNTLGHGADLFLILAF